MPDYSQKGAPVADDQTADPGLDAEPGEEDKEEELPDYSPDEMGNMAPFFGETKEGLEELREISELVKGNFDAAQEADSKEIQQLAEDIRVYLGQLPDKPAGFQGAANVHLPIMLKTITRLSARVSSELFGNWKDFLVVLPTAVGDDEKIADALAKHSNWQLANQIPDFQRQADIGVDFFFLYGDVTCHSTYDTVNKRNRHEMLNPSEFVVPAVNRTTMPDYSDVPFRCRIMNLYKHDLEARRDVWFDVERVLEDREPSWDDGPEDALAEAGKSESGIDNTEEPDATPYKTIWYEGWLELPKQKTQRFCKVIFDYESGAIYDLSLHEQANWQDAQRHDKQLQELMAYRQATSAYMAQQQQMQQQVTGLEGMVMSMGPGVPPEQHMAVQGQYQQARQQLDSLKPPPPPEWADRPDDPEYAPEPPRKEPINLFAHAVCIEPPAGPRGVSFGRQEADYNRAADTAMSQFIDQATLNNMKSFVARDDVEFKEKPALMPGAIKHLTGFTGTDIRDAILPLDVGAGNPQLVQVVQMCEQFAEDAIQAPGVLAGEPGKSGETARGYGMRVEQAVKTLTASARRLARFYQQIAKNNAALNAKFLSDEEFFMVQDPETQAWQMMKVGRKMYERNYMVEFRTDMTFSSKAQRVGEADSILQMIGAIPTLQQDIPLIQYSVRKCLEARGYKDYAQFLGPQMPPPQTPLGMPPPAPPGAPPGGPPGAPQGQPGAVPPGQSPSPAPKGQPSPPAPPPPPEPGTTPAR